MVVTQIFFGQIRTVFFLHFFPSSLPFFPHPAAHHAMLTRNASTATASVHLIPSTKRIVSRRHQNVAVATVLHVLRCLLGAQEQATRVHHEDLIEGFHGGVGDCRVRVVEYASLVDQDVDGRVKGLLRRVEE